MADVFISYSRRDTEVVRRIHDELEQRGKDVWVDWEDIPPASEFERDLEQGIAGSDAFVFVLSPDSQDSTYCQRELEHAEERNKRIVPINHRPVDVPRLPEALRTRNWIPSQGRFEEDFEHGIAALVDAIETDLEWVRAHTHWGARAEEWRESDRDRSFLLRGAELAAAEGWIAAQEGKEPPPTRLQGEYVLESRRAATRRQRRTLAATGAALVVAIGLAILALIQRNEAVSQRDQALSRALAATVAETVGTDPELATLLALSAVETRATPEAEASLRQALGLWRLRLVIDEPGPPLWRGAFSPDGELIATADRDSEVQLWRSDTGERVGSFSGRGRIEALGFSSGGDQVVAVPGICGDCNGYGNSWDIERARAWETATGNLVATGRSAARSLSLGPEAVSSDGLEALLLGPRSRLPITERTGRRVTTLRAGASNEFAPVALSPDGARIALGGLRPGIWDARSGRPLVDLYSAYGAFADVAFSPDGKLLAAIGYPDTLVLDPNDGEQIAAIPDSGFGFGWVGFSPDGSQVLTAPSRGLAGLWDPRDGRTLAELGPSARVRSAAFSPDGRRVLTTSVDGTARIWESEPAGVSFTTRRPAAAASLSPDGERVALADQAGAAFLYDAASGKRIAALGRPSRYPAARYSRSIERNPKLLFSADGSLLVESGAGGEARVWRAETGERVARLGGGATADAVPVPGHSRVVVTKEKPYGRTEVWDARDQELEHTITTGPRFGPGAVVSPTGDRIATFGTRGMVWDLEGERLLNRPMNASGYTNSAEFSPDGRYLATVDTLGPVRLWDAKTGRQVWQVDSDAKGNYPVRFSDDGSLVSNGSEVWDAATGRRLNLLQTGESLNNSDFSPDGKLMITSGGGNTLLWDVGTGEPLYEWNEGEGVVGGDLFGPDGAHVLTVGRDAAHLYECEVCGSLDDLIGLAERRVNRELTDDERATYGLD